MAPMTRSTEARIISIFQKKPSTVDHSTSEASMKMRDASGKDIGSVFFPSNLSPISSLKSAACIVVSTMRELAISANILDGATEQSAAWRPCDEHGARYANNMSQSYQLVVWHPTQNLHIRQRCIRYVASNVHESRDRCTRWWISI
jgi:hypothetical protein